MMNEWKHRSWFCHPTAECRQQIPKWQDSGNGSISLAIITGKATIIVIKRQNKGPNQQNDGEISLNLKIDCSTVSPSITHVSILESTSSHYFEQSPSKIPWFCTVNPKSHLHWWVWPAHNGWWYICILWTCWLALL